MLYDAPRTWGIGLIETISGVGDYAVHMFEESKKGIFTGYYDSNITITTKDRTNFRKLTRYHFPKPDEPQTLLGSLALYGGEFGVAYATGRAIYSSVAIPLKSMYPKIASVLENPGANMAFKEVAGGTVVTTPEARFTAALQQMGVTGEGPFGNWVDYIAGSKDDSVFEERFKSFIDSVYTGVGLATIAPLVMLTGKGAWYASRPAVKGSVEKGKQALAHGASYFDRIFRNYPVEEAMKLDLGGPKVIKTEELKRIQDIAKQQIEKAKGKERRKNLLAKGLQVVGKDV